MRKSLLCYIGTETKLISRHTCTEQGHDKTNLQILQQTTCFDVFLQDTKQGLIMFLFSARIKTKIDNFAFFRSQKRVDNCAVFPEVKQGLIILLLFFFSRSPQGLIILM